MATQINNDTLSHIYAEQGPIRVERSAFDHIEHGAKLVIVGITPGAQQRDLANAAYRSAIARGEAPAHASRSAKFAASFGGAMRANLVKLMDAVGANELVGLRSISEAFNPATKGKVHFTSALRYPVFYGGANFNGQISMLKSPALRHLIENELAEEVQQLRDAVWQPLGDKPMAALRHLVSLGVLRKNQIAPALPHPSGANNERIAFFLGDKPEADLSPKTNAQKIRASRKALELFYSKSVGVRA